MDDLIRVLAKGRGSTKRRFLAAECRHCGRAGRARWLARGTGRTNQMRRTDGTA